MADLGLARLWQANLKEADLYKANLARIFHESVLNWVFLGSGSSNCKVKKPIYVGIKKDFR
jgi:uncharacterized protein YjbI with pentapeptide repeats